MWFPITVRSNPAAPIPVLFSSNSKQQCRDQLGQNEISIVFTSACGRYDKIKVVLKEIISCQYCAGMNPTAGSFQITPRMQRHFVTFAVQMPGAEIVRSIYMQIIDGHLGGFDPDVAKMAGKLVDATIELHVQVMNNFLPSAVKFHYQFNLRELSNIAQGLTRMTKDYFKVPSNITSTISFSGDLHVI